MNFDGKMIYDRNWMRWGRIVETDVPFVKIEFEEGPLPRIRVPLRTIGKIFSVFWWDPRDSENARIDRELRENP